MKTQTSYCTQKYGTGPNWLFVCWNVSKYKQNIKIAHSMSYPSLLYHDAHPRQWYGKKKKEIISYYIFKRYVYKCYLIVGLKKKRIFNIGERHHSQFLLHSRFIFDWTALHQILSTYEWLSFLSLKCSWSSTCLFIFLLTHITFAVQKNTENEDGTTVALQILITQYFLRN